MQDMKEKKRMRRKEKRKKGQGKEGAYREEEWGRAISHFLMYTI